MSHRTDYDDYYIAFLDILGFSNLINTANANEINKIFNRMKKAKVLCTKWKGQNDVFADLRKKTRYYYFSDSVIMAIPSSDPRAFEGITSNCMLLQHALWSQCKPVWVRGAVVKGKLYCGKDKVFGPGLVSAVHMEEKIAKYPRIIMLPSTYEEGISDSANNEDIPYIVDNTDGYKMIETLRYVMYEYGPSVKEQIDYFLEHESDPHIREKYIWANKYYTCCINGQKFDGVIN